MPDPIKEKRLFPRVKLKLPLRYQIVNTPEAAQSVSEDLGSGGISFINGSFIAPNALVKLELYIQSKILSPVGRVTWSQLMPHSNRYRVGVEFTDFHEGEEKYLSDFINLKAETT
jgi:hypothetical protein